jgi:hypothetical protein
VKQYRRFIVKPDYRNLLLTAIALALVAILPITFAQDFNCPAVAEEAFQVAFTACSGLDRHQACYGHVLVDAVSQPGYSILRFEQPGDTADIAFLQSLNLAPYNPDTGVWGVAQMRLQADMPQSAAEDVTVLVFGNVGIDNAVLAPTYADVTLVDKPFLRVYTRPSHGAETSFWLSRGMTITARERLVDSSWLRVVDSEERIGWIPTDMITSDGNVRALNVVDPLAPFMRPMQAFYFESADDAASCAGLPPSGLLVQTPEGIAEVNLLINEVSISMNATAFVQSTANQGMTIGVLSGSATVSTSLGQQTIIPGTQVTIPMNAAGTPSGAPGAPQPYSSDIANLLPTDMLPTQIVASAPVTPLTAAVPVPNTQTSVGSPVTTTGGTTTTFTSPPVTVQGGSTAGDRTNTTDTTTTGTTTTGTTTTGTTTTGGGTSTSGTTTGGRTNPPDPTTTGGASTTGAPPPPPPGNCGGGQGNGQAGCGNGPGGGGSGTNGQGAGTTG